MIRVGNGTGFAPGVKRLAAAAALAAGTIMAGLPAGAQSLTDALILAYRSSPLLAQQRNLLRVEDEDVASAVATLRPTIGYIASTQLQDNDTFGSEQTTSIGLTLDWTVFDWGRRGFQIGAAKETVLATRWLLVQAEQQVLGAAVDAYLALALAIRTVDVQESNRTLLETQLQATRDRFEVGEVTRTDVAAAESQLAAAFSSLAAARGQVDIARENFRQATGQLPGATLDGLPPFPELPPSVERAQALGVQIHPTIRSRQHQVVAADILKQFAEAQRAPTLDLDGRLTGTEGENDRSVTLSLNGPIYTGGSISASVRQAAAQANATRADLANQARVITQNVGQAYAELMAARAQLAASDEQVRSARIAFEGFREEAALGARTTLDVLDAEQDLLDARITRLQAETDVQRAVYDALSAIGLLTAEHLGLSVERYDPDEYYAAVRSAPATLPHPTNRGDRLDRVLRRFGRGG